MLKPLRVLVALSDFESRKSLAGALEGKGLDPVFVSTLNETRAILDRDPVAMVFCETKLKDGGFKDLLGVSNRTGPKVPVVVCAPFYDKDLYLEAMCQGAYDFIAYPYLHQEVDWILSGALHHTAAAANRL